MSILKLIDSTTYLYWLWTEGSLLSCLLDEAQKQYQYLFQVFLLSIWWLTQVGFALQWEFDCLCLKASTAKISHVILAVLLTWIHALNVRKPNSKEYFLVMSQAILHGKGISSFAVNVCYKEAILPGDITTSIMGGDTFHTTIIRLQTSKVNK